MLVRLQSCSNYYFTLHFSNKMPLFAGGQFSLFGKAHGLLQCKLTLRISFWATGVLFLSLTKPYDVTSCPRQAGKHYSTLSEVLVGFSVWFFFFFYYQACTHLLRFCRDQQWSLLALSCLLVWLKNKSWGSVSISKTADDSDFSRIMRPHLFVFRDFIKKCPVPTLSGCSSVYL